VASSCARGEQPADSTRPAPLLGAAARDAGGPPGALAKPLADFTPDEFVAFTATLTFGGGADRPRTCRNAPGCEVKGGKRTAARVDAVDGQDSLDAAALTANGVVAARARVTGQYEEARYGMRPGAYEYYLVLFPGAGDAATWRLQQVETTPGARRLTEVATGTYRPCPHRFRKEKAYRATFAGCEGVHPNDSTMKLGLMQAFTDDPIWISCSKGCCIAQ
jgi:hypothetical protein